ncbi:hypothetical protein EKO27_g9567 [Xylaria grammica]|uniref:Fungal N-terminal domain-containing protein n=1 Tax=Xylaria grammica TaxID=363999 RepID=A0A439CTP3_9PEZI|nr:hypothetical protein EKO27_g9567 [Xylaria grammica]
MNTAELAVSLAGTILKVVVFFLDLIGDVKQVYKRGATDRNIDLSTIAESVAIATTGLEKHLSVVGQNGLREGQISDPDEERLQELSLRAADIGRELSHKLSRVTTDKRSSWKSFKAVALGMWDADDIEKTERRLNAIKDEIQFRILVSLRNKISQSYDEDKRRIFSTLEEVARKQARSKADNTRMMELLNHASKVGQGRHEEMVNIGNQLLHSINNVPISSLPSPILSFPVLTTLHDQSTREAAERTGYPKAIDQMDEIMRKMIEFLEECGAVEKEWKDDNSMKQILETCRKSDDQGSLTVHEDGIAAAPSKAVEPENDASNTLGGAETPNASTLSEACSHAASSHRSEASRRNNESVARSAGQKKAGAGSATSSAISGNTTRSKRGWRKRCDKLLRKLKHGLQRLK